MTEEEFMRHRAEMKEAGCSYENTDMILTDREVEAYKAILAVSRDSAVKKVLSARLALHTQQVDLRRTYRGGRLHWLRYMKEAEKCVLNGYI